MDQVQKFLAKIYKGIGSARSEHLLKLLSSAEWTLIQNERLRHPSTYASAEEYRLDAIQVELTRKLLLPGDTASRREAAVRTFWLSEKQCCATNARLDKFIRNQGPLDLPDEPVVEFITQWRKIISRVLGKPPLKLSPAYSQGSTLSDKGCLTTIPDKMSSRPTLYTRSVDAVGPHIAETEFARMGEFVDANRFFTVPKDSEKDRGCCIEASINIALQLAVGRWLKARYRKVYEVDLAYAQETHQKLAQKASRDGSLATIDLSNASDTIARKLIELLLPTDWYVLLNSLRASATVINGQRVFLEKFSSMGNGFTFELETIVFRTLCEAVGSKQAMVFGDDMIIETELSQSLIQALRFFGFTPNPKKTFCEGPFRESCGGDFYDGVPVRAHYLKELPDEPHQWIALANGVRRLDPSLRLLHSAWRFCVDQLPTAARVFGPAALGDLVVHDPEAVPVRGNGKHSDTFYWSVWQPLTRSFQLDKYWCPDVVLSCAVMGLGELVTPRGSVLGYKRNRVVAYGWSEGSKLADTVLRHRGPPQGISTLLSYGVL